MSPDERAAHITAQLAAFGAMEAALREIVDRPHYRIRGGEIVLDADGRPVPDPRPARDAQRRLDALARRRKRVAG